MVTLSALNTASTLLQRIVSDAQSASVTSSPATLGRANTTSPLVADNAAKSVSSAIFNAVTDSSEKQDESVKAVLDYIDREFTNFDKKFANMIAAYGDRADVQVNVADAKNQGKLLTAQVKADPTGIHNRLEQLKASRPDMTLEGVMSILVKELNRQNGR